MINCLFTGMTPPLPSPCRGGRFSFNFQVDFFFIKVNIRGVRKFYDKFLPLLQGEGRGGVIDLIM